MIYAAELPDLLPPSSRRHGIMLAQPFDEQRLAKWPPPYLLQPKFDGDRIRTLIAADGTCVQLSSECNEVTSLPHIKEALVKSGLRDIELDGESYRHGFSWEQIHGITSRTVNLHDDHSAMCYHIFDVVTPESQGQRYLALRKLEEYVKGYSCLQIAPCRLAVNLDEIMLILDEYVKLGYEGIIVRHLGAPYERKRSLYVMKWKPRRSDVYTIVGVTEAVDKHGNYMNMLGALVCCGDDRSETFKVGTGFDDETRRRIWQNPALYIGMNVEVWYQHLTHARGVPKFSSLLKLLPNP